MIKWNFISGGFPSPRNNSITQEICRTLNSIYGLFRLFDSLTYKSGSITVPLIRVKINYSFCLTVSTGIVLKMPILERKFYKNETMERNNCIMDYNHTFSSSSILCL